MCKKLMTPGCLNVPMFKHVETWFVIATKVDNGSVVATVLMMPRKHIEHVRRRFPLSFEIVIGDLTCTCS